ncbi:MAG TPA: NfeD family protein, partial [Syntrophales bacterium]|nr:NfeD family protein [Syntrophales bacterium]
ALRVSFKVLIPSVAVISLFFIAVIALVVKSQMQNQHTGSEGMAGEIGEAMTDVHDDGRVFIKGEHWHAFSDKKIEKGKKIKVVKVEGLKLKIEET